MIDTTSCYQRAGEWRIIDTPTSESVLLEASYIEALSPMVKDAPVMYELYYQQQWYNRYFWSNLKFNIFKHKTVRFLPKNFLVFGLSAEISFNIPLKILLTQMNLNFKCSLKKLILTIIYLCSWRNKKSSRQPLFCWQTANGV